MRAINRGVVALAAITLLGLIFAASSDAQNNIGGQPVVYYSVSPVGRDCTTTSPMVLYASQLYNCQSSVYGSYSSGGGFANPMSAVGDLILGGTGGNATRLPIGSNAFVLTSNGTTAAWAAVSATNATNLTGGVIGSLPYQSAASTTLFLAGNTAATDQTLISHGSGAAALAPTFSNAPALSAANMTAFPATLMTTSTPLVAAQEPAHIGDMTNSAGSLTTSVGKILGNTVPANATGWLHNDGAGALIWSNPAGAGTVTSVATTAPITGGTFTTSGTIACATCVTSASALTSNAVAIGGGGQASSTIAADTTTTHALFATAGAPAFRALVAGDVPTLNQATTSTAGNITGIAAIANGGSGQATASAAFGALAPAATRAGDVLYWNGSAYSTLAGNNSGTNFFQENASGVPSWAAGSSSITWGAISNPAGNLALTMGSNTTAFNYTTALANAFSWSNTTAALVGASQASPPLALCGTAWHSAASAQDCMTFQETPGTGLDAAITFAIGHTGTSTGVVTTTFPGPLQAGASGGVGGTLSLPEGTAATASSANDLCYGDSTLHGVKCSFNNGSFLNLPLETGTMTSGDLVSVNATTNLLADSGLVAANVATAAGTLTSNAVLIGGGSKAASAISADTTTTHALFATAGAPAFRALAATDIPAALSSSTSINKMSVTAPATSSTLAVADGKTLTASNSITLAGTDATTMTFPSVSGTIPRSVASGPLALATGAIASGTCAAAATAVATGTLTTDVVSASFNGDPTGVTGYAPTVNGMLSIITYPTADTFNVKVCNNTSASITPGAITLNWRVTR